MVGDWKIGVRSTPYRLSPLACPRPFISVHQRPSAVAFPLPPSATPAFARAGSLWLDMCFVLNPCATQTLRHMDKNLMIFELLYGRTAIWPLVLSVKFEVSSRKSQGPSGGPSGLKLDT